MKSKTISEFFEEKEIKFLQSNFTLMKDNLPKKLTKKNALNILKNNNSQTK